MSVPVVSVVLSLLLLPQPLEAAQVALPAVAVAAGAL